MSAAAVKLSLDSVACLVASFGTALKHNWSDHILTFFLFEHFNPFSFVCLSLRLRQLVFCSLNKISNLYIIIVCFTFRKMTIKDVTAIFDRGDDFNTKLQNTFLDKVEGLLKSSQERKAEISELGKDTDDLREDHAKLEKVSIIKDLQALKQKCEMDDKALSIELARFECDIKNDVANIQEELVSWKQTAKAKFYNLAHFAGECSTIVEDKNKEVMNLVAKFNTYPAIDEVNEVKVRWDDDVTRTRRLNDKALSDRIDTQVDSREKLFLKKQERLDYSYKKHLEDLEKVRTTMLRENAFLRDLKATALSVNFCAWRYNCFVLIVFKTISGLRALTQAARRT